MRVPALPPAPLETTVPDPERVTAELRRELGAVREERLAVRYAGLVTQLRLAGEVRVEDGRTTVRAEFDDPVPALALRTELGRLHGRPGLHAEIVTSGGTSLRYRVLVRAPGTDLARATGLVDRSGRTVLGLPPAVVAAGPGVAAGVWRGALLARGRVVRPAGRTRLVVTCPGPAVVLALVGAARGLGVLAAPQETVSEHRVVVRDEESVDAVLRSSGAPRVADLLARLPAARPVAGAASVPLRSVNARRAAEAAASTGDRVRRALDVLGAGAPAHLSETALLRLAHPDRSLAELGRLSDPPLSKDTVAGRLRRLVRLADEHGGDGA
ncbi:DNA-binding protein WhiA [Pseudonocardia spirodelae]|uniref:DNA-binding protein WhiA n=1 Tax=Pseudonocardia spirodelae TaxID=3133431 RepID=A0ABU8T4U9_9PSEU